MGAGCGGDDSDTAGDTDTVVTETEGITAEDTTTDEGAFATSECSSLGAAAASVATAFSATGDTGDLEDAQAQVEELADNAPAEIRDDLQVLVDAYDEFAEVLDDVDIEPGETPTAEAIQELQAAIVSIDQAEVTEAAANVNVWTSANC